MVIREERKHWRRHVAQIIRSRHYGWIGESRDGDPVDEVMRDILADVMHICKHEKIDFDDLVASARRQCEDEEADVERAGE
jgi:hypothetical protein